MTRTPRIILNNVSFQLNQTSVRFDRVSLTFESSKYGIVGRNGVGKTTFLKLLTGALSPDSGQLLCTGTIIDSPQSHSSVDDSATIAEALNVESILQAILRINQGSIDEKELEKVRDHWDIEKRIEAALGTFNLWPVDLNQLFHQLSGGQKTKVLLAKTLIFKSDFVIFDEPTNNLDVQARNVLYQHVENSSSAMIIVSHNRSLLNRCDKIFEFTSKGIELYGGNYDFYKDQKQIKNQAIMQEIQARSEISRKSKQLMQTRMERHQQNESRGRKEKEKQIKGKGSYNKIELKSKKGKSERTNRRIRLQAERKLEAVDAELLLTRAKLKIHEKLNVMLEGTKIPSNKTVIKINDLCFSYDGQNNLINNFNLTLVGSDRIAITGPNGCGKSTLIQLIRGLLAPCSGNIIVGVEKIAYLDQSVSMLDANLSIIDNFLRLNPKAKPFDAYSALASFKFRNKDAEKNVGQLSGGERMRAGLAISLMASNAPQLIILDEPTNHLDLQAIEAIEEALTLYQGAILAISHDDAFLKNIKIKKSMTWHFYNKIST